MTKIVLYSDEELSLIERAKKEMDKSPNLIYVKEPNSFSTTKPVEKINESDLQQVREWKNKVIEIRDSKKGSELYVTWDLEAKRLVEFLNSFNSSLD